MHVHDLQVWQFKKVVFDLTVEMAPAKLNLGLEILGKRPDGYHDLVSVFQTVDLYDKLSFQEAPKGQTIFTCSDPNLPQNADNLVCRAVDIFRMATGFENGIQIHLEKHIPYGAGLGGGSSDAATVLLTLNRLWQAGLSVEDLRNLGLKLGSDVPFFMQKGAALVQGRGERLRYISVPGQVLYVLVAPPFEIATGWAYANYKKALTEKRRYATFINSVSPDRIYISDLLQHLENDFLPLILQTYPEAEQILQIFEQSGAVASSLSGSGSTLYGAFDVYDVAHVACSIFREKGYRAFLCQPISES